MKVFHEEIHGLFLHLQSRHLSPSYSFPSDPRLFSLKTKKYLHRNAVIGVYRFYENGSTETLRRNEDWGSFPKRLSELNPLSHLFRQWRTKSCDAPPASA
jgi:hypothetical protein